MRNPSTRLPRLALILILTSLFFSPGPVAAELADSRTWSKVDRPSHAAVPPVSSRARAVANRLTVDLVTDKGTASDPFGDTFGSGAPQIDILELTADVVTDVPVIFVTFAGAVSPGDSGMPNAVVGYLDIDVDQNGATGDNPWIDGFNPAGPSSGMGNEYYVDLFSYSSADDGADVVDDLADVIVGRTPVLVGGNQMIIILDPSLLGDDDGAVDVATVLGTVAEPTDVAPNMGSVPSDTSTLLQNVRFRTSIEWRRLPSFPTLRPALVSDFRTMDSANFYFVNPNNLEFLVKVLDGCPINGHFWVFFAGTTDAEFTVTVEDLSSGQVRQYSNPQGNPADAVIRTQAFATCP